MAARWRLVAVSVALLSAATPVAGFDVEGGAPKPAMRPPNPGQPQAPQQGMPPMQRPGGIGGQIGNAKAEFSKWYRMYQGFVAGAAKVSQLISFICGVWLILSAPLAILGAVITASITDALTISYLAMYGVLLAGMEIPLGAVQNVLKTYFFFVYTRAGRAAFVAQVAVLAWGSKNVGFMSKALMAFNAVLTFYIMNSQDRRFAAVDAEAKAKLDQATQEMRGSVSEALSFGKMFSGAFGGRFGGSSSSRSAVQPQSAAAPPSDGGFSQSQGPADGEPPAWPSGGGNN